MGSSTAGLYTLHREAFIRLVFLHVIFCSPVHRKRANSLTRTVRSIEDDSPPRTSWDERILRRHFEQQYLDDQWTARPLNDSVQDDQQIEVEKTVRDVPNLSSQNSIADDEIYLLSEFTEKDIASRYCDNLFLDGDLSQQFHSHIFTPEASIKSPKNMTLSIPEVFIVDEFYLKKRQYPDIPLYLCLEQDQQLSIHRIEFTTKNLNPEDGLVSFAINDISPEFSLRAAALIMDEKWSNRKLDTPHAQLAMKAPIVERRHVYTQKCDPSRGENQPCCLFKFTYNQTDYGMDGGVVTFHRCKGWITDELQTDLTEDHANDSRYRHLSRGFEKKIERRLMCKESRFRTVDITESKGETGFLIRPINNLDAVECVASP